MRSKLVCTAPKTLFYIMIMFVFFVCWINCTQYTNTQMHARILMGFIEVVSFINVYIL